MCETNHIPLAELARMTLPGLPLCNQSEDQPPEFDMVLAEDKAVKEHMNFMLCL